MATKVKFFERNLDMNSSDQGVNIISKNMKPFKLGTVPNSLHLERKS